MRSTITGLSLKNMIAVIIGVFICFMAIPSPSYADPQWSVGISVGNKGINEFNLSIGEYYRVPPRQVDVIHEQGIYEEDLPVVFFIAQRAHVHPEDVVNLRLGGMSWMDITLHFGLSPEIYYVPVVIDRYGPPYGHAYGYYHSHPRSGWRRNDLRDRDIVNQVNLRFISEHRHYAPEKVMRCRSNGQSFTAIDRDIRKERREKTMHKIPNNHYMQNQSRQNMTKSNQTRQGQYMQNMQRPNITKPNHMYTQNTAMTKENRQNKHRMRDNSMREYAQNDKRR